MAIPRSKVLIVTAGCVLLAAAVLGSRLVGGQTDDPLLTYFIAEGDPAVGYRPSDHDLATWAFEAWARSAAGAIKLQSAAEADALVRLYWAPPQGSLYGEMRPLSVGGRRGAAVYITTD